MKTSIPFAILLALALSLVTGCVSDNGKFPQPTAGFTPKQAYSVPYDKVWNGILDALNENRITTVGVDKASGTIGTDYLAGPGSFMVIMAQSTRYKYGITVRSQPDGTVKVDVICKVESTINGGNGSSQWRDVTPQNAALASKLETWLYEQIEKKIQ
ncbi:MAG: hypothetical protein P4N59_14710 [Negativicutes bacterium]|nr:hypothetical protein [Negativicutes bacterium]